MPIAASHTGNARKEQRPWTPLPDPFDAETYTAWGRKHYGEDWYEQRETMLRERNFLKRDVRDDHVFLVRQADLRKMERKREEGKLLLDEGKTWQEVLAWARWHYGELWHEQQQALARDKQAAKDEALSPENREKKKRKADKRAHLIYEMQLVRDEEVLAGGKTWDDIMAWPPTAEQRTVLPAETGSADMPSPSSSSGRRSDDSGISTYPPTPTDARRQALDGPRLAIPSEKLVWTSKGGWGGVEVGAIRSRLTEADYARRKRERVEAIRKARSQQEEEEAYERDRQEQDEIRRNRGADDFFSSYYKYEENKREREESMKALDLRHKAWMLEQVNSPPGSQEEMNRRFDRWEIQGLSRKEGNRLARMYGFPERPPVLRFDYEPGLIWPPPRLEERLPLPVLSYPLRQTRPPPKDEVEMEQRFRYWDGRLSRAEQNELARMYGFGERPSCQEGDDEPRGQQQRPSPPVEDASHRTFGGRITKNTRRGRSGTRSVTGNTPAVPPDRKRQRKTYTKERASQRLAGQLPEFGMLPGRGEARPLHNASPPPPLNTAQTRSLDPRTGKPPRAGAKPQGIAKFKKQRSAGAGRSRGLARS